MKNMEETQVEQRTDLENTEVNCEMIWKMQKNSRLNCEKIGKIWKKSKSNSGKIQTTWKKDKLKCEMIC